MTLVAEMYVCIRQPLSCDRPTETKHQRQPSIEEDPQEALASIEDLRQNVLRIAASKLRLDTPISVEVTVDPRHPNDTPLVSTLGREIWFVRIQLSVYNLDTCKPIYYF